MTIFGINTEINLNNFHHSISLEQELTDLTLKRSGERKIFLEFLAQKTSSGRTVFAEMQEKARSLVKNEDIQKVGLEGVKTYVVSELKAKKNGHLNLYESIVFGLVGKINPSLGEFQRGLEAGKIGEMPSQYPSLRNKAEIILAGKISSGIGRKEKQAYLARKRLEAEIRKMSQEMFFATNKLKLEEEKMVGYLMLIFELSNLFASEQVRYNFFRELVVDSLQTGQKLKLIAMKCLRLVYPQGARLRVLESMDDQSIINKDGEEYFPIPEVNFFERLGKTSRLFLDLGVDLDQIVLIADLDLDDYFPRGGENVVPDADIEKAKISTREYAKDVQSRACSGVRVLMLSDYLARIGVKDKYYQVREKVFLNLKKSGNIFIDNNTVERRVDYRYNSNKRIFVVKPTREFARERTYAQLASLKALEVLNDGGSVLLTEPKGEEERLIGGQHDKSLPVIFVQLRG